MAGITQSHITTIQNDSGAIAATATAVLTGEVEEAFSVSVGAASQNDLVLSIDVSNIVAFWITTDKDISVKTNDDGTPDQTIAVDADTILSWNEGQAATNPLTVDITKLSFNHPGTGTATVSGSFIFNA